MSSNNQKKVQEELKKFFKQNKPSSGQSSQLRKSKEELLLNEELEFEISDKNTIDERIKALESLSEKVLNQQLEDYALEKLCQSTEDILRSTTKNHRHTVLYFFKCLVQGQYTHSRIMRQYFFNVVKNTENIDDAVPKFELFKKLTDNGKDLVFFEEEVGHYLVNWTPIIVAAGKAIDFLKTLVNYIKYNAAYADDDIINGIVQYMTYICCQSGIEEVVKEGLNVLDAIVCYCNISQQTMPVFISALSRTVCLDAYNTASWKIMRNLLGTHMGHFCLLTMCKMLQDDETYSDIGLVCGMIFNINMALLHNRPEFIIFYLPNPILPSIEKAAACSKPVIIMEVCACIKWTIEKYGRELKEPLWERIFVIIEILLSNIDKTSSKGDYRKAVHDLFSKIDFLFENDQFKGDTSSFFRLIRNWYPMVTEKSVIRLIDYSIKFLIPIEENWLTDLNSLMLNFFQKETRTEVRVHVLKKFESVLMANRHDYEKDLIDSIVTPFFSTIPHDDDDVVRKAVIEFLLRFSSACSNIYMEPMLNILERVLRTPFEDVSVAEQCQKDPKDIEITLNGLNEIFTVAIHRLPSSNAIKILSMLVTFLLRHYEKPHIFESVVDIRLTVMKSLLKLRSDSRYRLGYDTGDKGLKFSLFLVVEHEKPPNISLSAVSSVDNRSSICSLSEMEHVTDDITYISLSNACHAVVTALKHEKDWKVLEPVLQRMPDALKYKALILSQCEKDVEPLVNVLTSMIVQPPKLDALRNTPANFSKIDLYSAVVPILSAFASYHAHLMSNQQQRIIKSLEIGLVAKSAPKCVTALMICLLEMKDGMTCLIPEVLLNLSKISATKPVAIPTLEFLSMLATFPRVYANFTSKQYMSIFAIIFPYTNAFKYDHYTVSLAHHVIAVWFFKCRKPFRPDFVKFIIKGLRQNATPQPPENVQLAPRENLNEDSSNRKRSSSLTEQSNRKKEKERHMSGSGRLIAAPKAAPSTSNPKLYDETLILFHRELTDTCIDLMSRVTYSSCSALPKRFTSTDFFLHDGQKMTWLIGLTLITVTVSGCTQKPMRNGLCDKCCNYCTIGSGLTGVSDGPSDSPSYEGLVRKQNESSSSNLDEKSTEGQQSQNSTTNVSTTGDDECVSENSDRNKRIVADELDISDQCACWCQGWAEIYVRGPTGDVSWVMRCQNDLTNTQNFDPLTDLSTLYHPYITNEQLQKDSTASCLDSPTETSISPVAQMSQSLHTIEPLSVPKQDENSDTIEEVADLSQTQDDGVDECCHSRNPVRRSHSSPEMSSNWKNAYMKDSLRKDSSRSFNNSPVHDSEHVSENVCSSDCRKGAKCYAKELRGNCEAIPEEFSGQGTTPPKPGILSLVAERSGEEELNMSTQSSHPTSSDEKSPETKSDVTLLPSFSFEDVNTNPENRRLENRFFDKHSMPNEHFEFNRSASVSQVVPPFKKSPATVSSISLNLASSQPHLTTKPPLSPPTYVSRSSKQPKDSTDSFSQLSSDYKRNRLNTISVMNSSKKTPIDSESPKNRQNRSVDAKKYGISPSFVFLQLYHASHFGNSAEHPVLVPSTPTILRAITVFDRIPPYETHKVGVIYVGPGQANNETEILKNPYGSVRYSEFLSNLGTLVNLAEVNPQNIFLGGLEKNGDDGKYAYVWKDDVMQVIFHIATLMPNKETDAQCNNKKKHIGNDYVIIVYNDSGEEYDLRTMKCQYNFACVIVEPLDHGSNQLIVKAKHKDLTDLIGEVEMKIVSDKNVSLLARQLALHINLASMIKSRLSKENGIYASNWLERLRKIKHIKTKVAAELGSLMPDAGDTETSTERRYSTNMCDFTEYTA